MKLEDISSNKTPSKESLIEFCPSFASYGGQRTITGNKDQLPPNAISNFPDENEFAATSGSFVRMESRYPGIGGRVMVSMLHRFLRHIPVLFQRKLTGNREDFNQWCQANTVFNIVRLVLPVFIMLNHLNRLSRSILKLE